MASLDEVRTKELSTFSDTVIWNNKEQTLVQQVNTIEILKLEAKESWVSDEETLLQALIENSET